MEPPLAAGDLGAEPWERALIKASRERHFLWRTEQTYREWSVRFARFLAPRSPDAASGDDVAAFLSEMAVQGRASPSAQKQALNALVFLMQEALHRDLGQMEFTRPAARRRVPTVLSQGECKALFAQLEGTPRLMVELAYGAGLRLMELLRLRVHHLDLDRLRLQVLGGKGDKDRVTVLPEKLVPALRERLARLREQWTMDRAAKVPGVWLPEGLARKYPKAGRSWEWQWLFPARELSRDPASGVTRRHHLSDTSFQRTVKGAAAQAGLNKRVTPHTFRHSFATHLLEGGTDIRTVQELMGHASVETTQIYLHVMQKPGLGVRSPLDHP
ncbi:MAG: integron integrase [Lacunisphaera sp.]|nr:integron integrase [Lacunisphaera sp.]